MKARKAIFFFALFACTCTASYKHHDTEDDSDQQTKKPTLAEHLEPSQPSIIPNAPGYKLPLDTNDIADFHDVGQVIDVNSVMDLIRQNGFGVLEPGVYSKLSLQDFDGLYMNFRWGKIPAFVTVDTGLYFYHTILDDALKSIEDAASEKTDVHIGDANRPPFTIGEEGARTYPQGLELMAMLGSLEAGSILSGEGDADYERREQGPASDRVDWHENLYWSWLYPLRALLQDTPEECPEFMRTQAWQRRRLNAALASWTRFNHRIIRDRDPSELTFPIPVKLPPPPPALLGYVEPIPVFWERLLSLTRMASAKLDSLGVLTPESRGQFNRLEELLQRISNVLDRQLAGEPPSPKDVEFFEEFPSMLRKMLPGAERHGLATIRPAGGTEIRPAVGDIDLIIVACPTHDGKIRLAVGPVLSYYEFKNPPGRRLTDETWRLMLDSPARPGRLDWYSPFIRFRKDFSGLARLTHTMHNEGPPCWSPDGRYIAFVGPVGEELRGIYVMNADGTGKKNLTNFGGCPGWFPDGKIAFGRRVGEICVMDPDGSNLKTLTDLIDVDSLPRWSPDGKKIAFWSNRTGAGDIYVANADGSDLTRLTDNPTHDWNPCWSPDGKQIAFHSYGRDWPFDEIFVMNADGSEKKRLTHNSSYDMNPCWSPNGKRIAFESTRGDGYSDLYVMNVDGSGQKRLTNNGRSNESPSWSPDGKQIAFLSIIGTFGNPEICILNLE